MTPTESELEILQILWEKEPATVRAIHDELIKKRDIGYTTTLKQFQRMTEKGMLEKIDAGKAHEYNTLVKPASIQKGMFDKLLNTVFNGSTSELLMHALGNSETTEAELKELEAFLKKKKKE
ncbi:MAG: BlaI family penicillinase repressor [Saprospiraceae bacterium]|jgi:BlaI family penicillinase repressor